MNMKMKIRLILLAMLSGCSYNFDQDLQESQEQSQKLYSENISSFKSILNVVNRDTNIVTIYYNQGYDELFYNGKSILPHGNATTLGAASPQTIVSFLKMTKMRGIFKRKIVDLKNEKRTYSYIEFYQYNRGSSRTGILYCNDFTIQSLARGRTSGAYLFYYLTPIESNWYAFADVGDKIVSN